MFCVGCGKTIKENEKFCRYCGTKRYDFETEISDEKKAEEVFIENTKTESIIQEEITIEEINITKPVVEPVNQVNINPEPQIYVDNESFDTRDNADDMTILDEEIIQERPVEKKKKYTGLIVTLSIISIILIMAIGVVGYMYFNNLVFDFEKLKAFEHPFVAADVTSSDPVDTSEEGGTGEEGEPSGGTVTTQTSTDTATAATAAAEEATPTPTPTPTPNPYGLAGEKWSEGERGEYFQCAEEIPAGVDNKVWGMSMDDFALYTGITFGASEKYEGSNDIMIYRFPQTAISVNGVIVDEDSYVVTGKDGKVCGFHMEYKYDGISSINDLQYISEELVSNAAKGCQVESEYIYYDDYPFVCLSSQSGQDAYIVVEDSAITFCSAGIYGSSDDNTFVNDFKAKEGEIAEKVAALEKADSSYKAVSYDVDSICAEIAQKKNEYEQAIFGYRFYENDDGVVSWYLNEKKVPVYVNCRKGYHDFNYERIYLGTDVNFAYVEDDFGNLCEYYFNKGKLIRVIDSRGNIHDAGSRQWGRYSEREDMLVKERTRLSGTIKFFHEQKGYDCYVR